MGPLGCADRGTTFACALEAGIGWLRQVSGLDGVRTGPAIVGGAPPKNQGTDPKLICDQLTLAARSTLVGSIGASRSRVAVTDSFSIGSRGGLGGGLPSTLDTASNRPA